MNRGCHVRQAEDAARKPTSCSLLISYLVYRRNVVWNSVLVGCGISSPGTRFTTLRETLRHHLKVSKLLLFLLLLLLL